MKEEIQSAVDFLVNIFRSRDDVNEAQIQLFSSSLYSLLCDRYQDHWFPEKPFKGSGYRCIRLNHNMDPLILKAGQMSGLDSSCLKSTFPPELTIWVDPRDVSFRIGENGSVGILYEKSKQNQTESISTQQDSQLVVDNQQQLQQQQQQQQQTSTLNINSLKSCKEQFLHGFSGLHSDINLSHMAACYMAS